jgi:hypothetical protein
VSPLRLRPDLHLPWQALALFAAALYVIESALRGWDFRPTVLDGIVYGGLALLIVVRALVAKRMDDGSD